MTKDYGFLDTIVICAALMIVAGIMYGLFMAHPPETVLPVIASLSTAILGLPVAYGAYRWGSSVGSKEAQRANAETSAALTGAVAQLAGAGPQPPAAPLSDPAATPEPGA